MKASLQPMSFNQKHKFELRDGRRFASLVCAVHTVMMQPKRRDCLRLLPVIDEMGIEYDWAMCLAAIPRDKEGNPWW